MSDTQNIRSIPQSITSAHEELSVEQLELYQEFITKTLELRKAEEALLSAMNTEEGGDTQTSDTLKIIREILENTSYKLSGSECVILACLHKDLEGEEYVATKRINIYLHSYDRKPANTTKIVDNLEKKNFIQTNSDGLHSHKTYRLTKEGQKHTLALITRLTQDEQNDKITIIS